MADLGLQVTGYNLNAGNASLMKTVPVKTTNVPNTASVKAETSALGAVKKNNMKPLLLSLSGLAVLGGVGVCVLKAKSNVSQLGYDCEKIYRKIKTDKSFYRTMVEDARTCYDDFAGLNKHLKAKDKSLEFLNDLFALKMTRNSHLESVPDVISISNVKNEEFSNLNKLLSKKYGTELRVDTYKKGSLKELVDSFKEVLESKKIKLEEIAKKEAKRKSQKVPEGDFVDYEKNLLIQVDNTKEFFEDLLQNQNSEIKKSFCEILKDASKNRISFVFHGDLDPKFLGAKTVNLKFESSLKNVDFEKSLEFYERNADLFNKPFLI